jgi:hypothetical protein
VKFRKKVPLEAFPVKDLFDNSIPKPDWVVHAIEHGTISSGLFDDQGGLVPNELDTVHVVTREGSTIATADKWIAREPVGAGVYPISAEVLEAAYEPIEGEL